MSQANQVLPDFQGGLVTVTLDRNTWTYTIGKLDGTTGQPYPAYSPGEDSGANRVSLGANRVSLNCGVLEPAIQADAFHWESLARRTR